MRKHVLAACILVCTAIVSVAVAQLKTNDQKKPPKPPTTATKTQTGELVSVDAAKNEIVIKDDAGAEIHLLIGTSTKITREGKAISLGELKVGDKVTSECEESTDGCKAKSISVIPREPN